jgi:hypothetical protein
LNHRFGMLELVLKLFVEQSVRNVRHNYYCSSYFIVFIGLQFSVLMGKHDAQIHVELMTDISVDRQRELGVILPLLDEETPGS